ncbi:MAG: hypothetical protein ACI8P3_000748 [Saprospiraceae bacterium]|jgi:hypothetical protein
MLREIGAVYFVLLVLVCFGFFMGLVESVVRSQSIWMGLIGAMIASSIHFSRKDSGFLKMLEVKRVKLYIMEYLLLTTPLAIAFLGGSNFGAILVQTLSLVILVFLPNPEMEGSSFSNKLNFNFLPKELFEARSYLRRFAIPLGLCYILGLITSKYMTIPIVMVLLTALLFTAFFDEIESKALFEAIHFRKGILSAKIQSYLGLYFLLLLPYILLFLILHFEYWYILLVVLFVGSTVILFNIFYKYSHYAPYRRRVYNSTVNAIFFGFAMVPFFYPVTLLYVFYYWRKARKNIRLYYAENK